MGRACAKIPIQMSFSQSKSFKLICFWNYREQKTGVVTFPLEMTFDMLGLLQVEKSR